MLAIPSVAQVSKTILVHNPGQTAFTDAVVEIPWATVRQAFPRIDTARLRVVQLPGMQEVPYQLEHGGQPTVQNLLVWVSVGAGQTLRLELRPEKPAPVVARTFCRYVPERKDDFAWENDRVAFRIYGHALESTNENAYGTDIWAKRTDRLVLNDWYKRNDYHTDHGDGLDYYHVGFTLGAGGIGVFLGDTIGFFRNYRTWEVLDNGPLRSTCRVKHAPQTFGPATVTLTKTISLDAGSQLSRVAIKTQSTPADLPMVVGITLRPDGGDLTRDEQGGILSYWEPQHGNDGTLGIGCLFPANGPVPMRQTQQHGLAMLRVKSGKTTTYFAGGAWDKANRIRSAAEWQTYLRQFADQQRHPLTITVEKR